MAAIMVERRAEAEAEDHPSRVTVSVPVAAAVAAIMNPQSLAERALRVASSSIIERFSAKNSP